MRFGGPLATRLHKAVGPVGYQAGQLPLGVEASRGEVERLRKDGVKISSLQLKFLNPLEPGLKEIFSRFKQVMTVEINYSDEAESQYMSGFRRYAQLATILRSQTLIDIDCWSQVPGTPLPPCLIATEIRRRLSRN